MSVEQLEIKVVKIHRLPEGNHNTKAFVDLGINDAILVKGVRVVSGEKGIFVSMPSELGKDERWYERVRCLSKEAREMVNQKVLEAYNSGTEFDE